MTDAQRLSAAKAEYTGQLREFGNVSFSIWLLDRAEAAEAAEARADAYAETIETLVNEKAQLEAERDTFSAENYAVHRAINAMCGTNTSTVEAVQHVIEQRDELRTKLNEAMAIAHGFVAERDELRAKLEQAQRDLRLACNETDDDVTRLSWLQSLITSALPFIELISGEDINAGMMCISEVQSLHDDLEKLVSKSDTP